MSLCVGDELLGTIALYDIGCPIGTIAPYETNQIGQFKEEKVEKSLFPMLMQDESRIVKFIQSQDD